MITAQVLRLLVDSESKKLKEADLVAQHLQAAATKFEINTPLRVAHFLAQLAHESGFRPVEENLNYSAEGLCKVWPKRFTPQFAIECARKPERIAEVVYQGRLGNTAPGDGFKYRGRGFIQITGRDNYKKYSALIGHDILNSPELALRHEVSALIAAAFWSENRCNQLADTGDIAMVKAITLKVNGGLHGIAERSQYFLKAWEALK
jgi:putative chitinase